MKSLRLVRRTVAYLDRYVAIRDSKQIATRQALTAIHGLVTARFTALGAAAASRTLHGLTRSAAAIANRPVLRSCYDGSTKALVRLKQDIKERQPKGTLKYCPLCGTTLPMTTDHYLPSTRFPEFAVHPMNLVPCCSICNSIKKERWLENGARVFWHAYTDPVPRCDFLRVDLTTHPVAGVSATFSLTAPALPTAGWTIVQAHFGALNLIARYNELASDEIDEMLKSCASHVTAGGADPALFLQTEARNARQTWGRNHWRAVLMDALSAHADFLTWVQDRC